MSEYFEDFLREADQIAAPARRTRTARSVMDVASSARSPGMVAFDRLVAVTPNTVFEDEQQGGAMPSAPMAGITTPQWLVNVLFAGQQQCAPATSITLEARVGSNQCTECGWYSRFDRLPSHVRHFIECSQYNPQGVDE